MQATSIRVSTHPHVQYLLRATSFDAPLMYQNFQEKKDGTTKVLLKP